ncbi:LysR substrate-binding domain-containing protein [Piscinibacter sp. XHJ-5]|uniref:LysR substrate-binding domain-containing protein n=1 Tax=Piscinibacter sp. XHJ-5 TaxID=3037797 RepID=UPI00245308C7|nr:LysR substrate-binding domain-containing protein [Piscinibacter sp. XHJ-5]
MDQLVAMRAFVHVVEAGNFTKAARALKVRTPTVTRLIQGLEGHLQVRLLQRSTRFMALTAEGETYYERAVRLLAELADVDSSAKESAATPSGRLRVECAAAIGTMVIVPALAQFHDAYPGVELQMRIGNRRSNLIADGVDCAIRIGEVTEQFLVARRIGELQLATCASPQFLRSHGVPATPRDLRASAAVRMYSAHTGQPVPFRFATDAGPLEIAPAHSLWVNDIQAYVAAGLAGLGLIQAPTYAVREALLDGRLVAVLENWRAASIPVYVIYPPNRFLSAKVRVFIDWAARVFEGHADLKPSDRGLVRRSAERARALPARSPCTAT